MTSDSDGNPVQISENDRKLIMTAIDKSAVEQSVEEIAEISSKMGVERADAKILRLVKEEFLLKHGDYVRRNTISIPTGDTERVEWAKDGIRLRYGQDGRGGWQKVISGFVKPIARLSVDGDTFFKVKLHENGEPEVVRVLELVKKLENEGRVNKKKFAQDVISTVLNDTTLNHEVGHATYGIYEEGDGVLSVCESPVLVTSEQRDVWDQVRKNASKSCTKEQIQSYVDVLPYLHQYEILPPLGLGLAAPFTPILRREMILVPHLLAWAPESDIGKSTANMIASTYMYGLEVISGSSIRSNFRLTALLNQICLPIPLDETDQIDSRQFSDLKESAERWEGSSRGKRDLSMQKYQNRGVFLLSGNNQNIDSTNVLKRFFVNRFDSSSLPDRKAKSSEFDGKLKELRPIGFQLIRWYVEETGSATALLKNVEGWTEAIRNERLRWGSTKRPEAWACTYLGLKIFENGCKRCGVDWFAPSVSDFVKNVVEFVESSTYGLKRSNVEKFRSWFQQYRAKNTRRVYEPISREYYYETQGENETWCKQTVDLATKNFKGYLITAALLDEYNNQRKEEQIASLKELGVQAANEVGIPAVNILDITEERKVKKWSIGGKFQRAAFLPETDETEGGQ